jgi:hypothetical protein
MRTITLLALGFVLPVGPALAQGTPGCMIVAAKDATYEVNGKSSEGRMYVDDCKQIKAIKGTIEVCFEDATRRADCTAVEAGRPFERPASASRMRASWRKVGELFGAGQTITVTGVKRAHSGERRAGFPYGAVLPGSSLDIQGAGAGSLDLLVVERERPTAAPVLRAQNVALPAKLPAAALEPGATYKWQVRVGADQFSGGYNVLAEKFVPEVNRRLELVRSNTRLSADARAILEAEVYEDFGLIVDRDQVLARLK